MLNGCDRATGVTHEYQAQRDLEDIQFKVPAMLPRAQIACSLMCRCGVLTRLMRPGMAPPFTTAEVWSELPAAMLVRAQAASN